MRKKLMSCAALLPLFLLSGCGTLTQGIDGSCRVFRPISNSSKDTVQTRREVVAHNKVYGAICKG